MGTSAGLSGISDAILLQTSSVVVRGVSKYAESVCSKPQKAATSNYAPLPVVSGNGHVARHILVHSGYVRHPVLGTRTISNGFAIVPTARQTVPTAHALPASPHSRSIRSSAPLSLIYPGEDFD